MRTYVSFIQSLAPSGRVRMSVLSPHPRQHRVTMPTRSRRARVGSAAAWKASCRPRDNERDHGKHDLNTPTGDISCPADLASIAFPDLDKVLIARKSKRAVGALEMCSHVVLQGSLRWGVRDGEQVEHELGNHIRR